MAFPDAKDANLIAGRTKIGPARGAGGDGATVGDPNAGRALLRVIKMEPPHDFVAKIEQGGVFGQAAYHLEALCGGRTKVEHVVDLELGGWKRLMVPLLALSFRRDALAFKNFVESR